MAITLRKSSHTHYEYAINVVMQLAVQMDRIEITLRVIKKCIYLVKIMRHDLYFY